MSIQLACALSGQLRSFVNAAGRSFNPSRGDNFWPCLGPNYMRPGAFRWVFEVRTDVGYIAKVAIGSWSYGANFFS